MTDHRMFKLKVPVLLCLLWGMFVACGGDKQGLVLQESAFAINKKVLMPEEEVILKKLFSELSITQHSFKTKPDAIIGGYNQAQAPVYYSLYLKKTWFIKGFTWMLGPNVWRVIKAYVINSIRALKNS